MNKVLESVKKKSFQQMTPSVAIDAPATQVTGIVSKEKIQQVAYQKWEAAGKPCCDGTTFWAQAEKELQQK